jgi:hypothetical protein
MRTMANARTASVLVAILVAVVSLASACGDHEARAPVVVPSDVHLATSEPAEPAELVRPALPPEVMTSASARLEAVRTVALYCRLLDEGQFARAAALCTHRRLWSRRAFGSLGRLRFRSARVYAAPNARTFVLKTRVHVHGGRGCPWPEGLAILFFTLGRVGSAVGGWRITAVSTSP